MTFKEYYNTYLTLHKNKWNRRLHVLGQLITIAYFAACIYLIFWKSVMFLPMVILLPFTVYPFAWSGHFFIEKNKPAAFTETGPFSNNGKAIMNEKDWYKPQHNTYRFFSNTINKPMP